jgi:hypothetical protein
MSDLKVNRISPQTGGVIEIDGRIVFTQPIPGVQYAPVNDIGVPGAQGFGVGISPNTYAGFTALSGTLDPASGNYGNYQYSDGSIMCWIPAFWYKVGTGSNGLAVNRIDVKPFTQYASIGAAAAAGYALPRAFYEGGIVKAGFFMDKFSCANNNGIASSIKGLSPLSTAIDRNPISALTGTPANNYGGTLAAAKTRGAVFHTASIFQMAVLSILAKAHADASTSTVFNAWYQVGANFPKGNNNNAGMQDVNDPLLTFRKVIEEDPTYYAAYNGSGSVLAKTTHNGQESGVADVNGNVSNVTTGFTSDGTNFYIAGVDQVQNNFTAANAFGAPAGWINVGPTFGFAGNFNNPAQYVQRFGNAANQVLEEETSGNLWLQASAAIPRQLGVSVAGTNEFGSDFALDGVNGNVNMLAPIRGGGWSHGSGAGVFALVLNNSSANSAFNVGFRACSFGAL